MSGNVILIAGQSGAKSTFAGGLYHYLSKTDDYNIVPTVWGNQDEFDSKLVDKMFTQGEYPDQTLDGYVAKFKIHGKAFSRPGLEVDIIDFPGEQVKEILNPPNDLPLLERIREGNVPDEESVAQDFENNVKAEFRRGRGPGSGSWETLFLHYYYQADKAIFLMNMLKTVDPNQIDVDVDPGFIYGPEEINQANQDFNDVAFIPIAVDWYGYDSDSFEPSVIDRFVTQILKPARRDKELMNYLTTRIDVGANPDANRILNCVDRNGEIDFFSVSVPDKGSPQSTEGILTGDGHDGFVVRGFDEVIRWLET